jgi:hypothetical protein
MKNLIGKHVCGKSFMQTSAGFIALAFLQFPSPAAALQINLIDVGGVTGTRAEAGFRAAARYWESVIANDVVLNFEVGFAPLQPDQGGGAISTLAVIDFQSYQQALVAGRTSALDSSIAANLAPLDQFGGISARVPDYADLSARTGINLASTRLIGGDGAPVSVLTVATSANLRALGVDQGEAVDARIVFSSSFSYDFNPGNGINPDRSDFVGIAIHEMGHALGFQSGADLFDILASSSDGLDVDANVFSFTLDQFRYSAPGEIDWQPNTQSYFSIDGGKTALLDNRFATGETFGDGDQASHWKSPGFCGVYLGIMNPFICPGQNGVVRSLDLSSLDAIGWNLNVDTLDNPQYAFATNLIGVPEPDTWITLILGFAFTGAAVRRRRPVDPAGADCGDSGNPMATMTI